MTYLGQNFLKSKKIARKIVDTAQIKPGDTILEVGPGKGILTGILLEKVGSASLPAGRQGSPQAGRVIAVEKDAELVEYLHKKFSAQGGSAPGGKNHKNLELIHGDILKIENLDLFTKLKIKSYKIVSNLPYYITSHFLKTFLETENQPTTMTLTIQKEVAQRIVAKPHRMSLLSLSVQTYGKPKIAGFISKNKFSPIPKVDSAILTIDNISKDFFKSINEHDFFSLLKKGFSSKRKMLKNNLKISSEVLKKAGLSEKTRAQELSLENWKCLYLRSLQ